MSRTYTCNRCDKKRATDARRGPLPKLCDPCKLVLSQPRPEPVKVWTPPPTVEPRRVEPPPEWMRPGQGPVPSPWTGAEPTTPAPPPPAPYEAGPLEIELRAELAALKSVNPVRGTLAGLALKIARAADMADPGDLKATITAGKELRSVLAELSRAQGGDDDDDNDETPFGSSGPEMVNPPPV